MNLKRAFKALWDPEDTDEQGIPVLEKLEVSQEKLAVFIRREPVDPIKDFIEKTNEPTI